MRVTTIRQESITFTTILNRRKQVSCVTAILRSINLNRIIERVGTLRFLDAIKETGMEKRARFSQAPTSELEGLVQEVSQTEKPPFYPRSPYGEAKLYGY